MRYWSLEHMGASLRGALTGFMMFALLAGLVLVVSFTFFWSQGTYVGLLDSAALILAIFVNELFFQQLYVYLIVGGFIFLCVTLQVAIRVIRKVATRHQEPSGGAATR